MTLSCYTTPRRHPTDRPIALARRLDSESNRCRRRRVPSAARTPENRAHNNIGNVVIIIIIIIIAVPALYYYFSAGHSRSTTTMIINNYYYSDVVLLHYPYIMAKGWMTGCFCPNLFRGLRLGVDFVSIKENELRLMIV